MHKFDAAARASCHYVGRVLLRAALRGVHGANIRPCSAGYDDGELLLLAYVPVLQKPGSGTGPPRIGPRDCLLSQHVPLVLEPDAGASASGHYAC